MERKDTAKAMELTEKACTIDAKSSDALFHRGQVVPVQAR